MVEAAWITQPGERVTRAQLAALYGGSVYSGGVVPSTTTPNVLIFSDPRQGEKSGYLYDGRDPDSSAFFYTGKGGSGDQTLIVNSALARHVEQGRALRLFVADGRLGTSQTAMQKYVGEYRVDPTAPWQERAAPGRDGKTRMVLVFRLLPVGDETGVALTLPSALADDPGASSAVMVPEEVHSQRFFEVSGTEAGVASRTESNLVERFRNHSGVTYVRWAIRIGVGATQNLLTDVYDPGEKLLYEAKSSASRAHVRMAIGQLMDYSRFLDVPGLSCTVLLPARPTDDLCDLIGLAGFGLVYEEDGGFVTWAPEQEPTPASEVRTV